MRLKALPVFGALVLAAVPALAGEFAVLATGFRIQVERHEPAGENIRLYSKDGGVMEMPAAQIAGFEPDDSVVAGARPASQTQLPAMPPDPAEVIKRAAERWGLPEQLIHSVARAESGYRTDAVSPKGAIGVMQLMPQTARELGANPHDLEQNINAGARYLRELLIKYDRSVNKALAAYNAGPGAVDRYNGIPPYRETVKYVERVVRDYLKRRN